MQGSTDEETDMTQVIDPMTGVYLMTELNGYERELLTGVMIVVGILKEVIGEETKVGKVFEHFLLL